MNMRTVIPECVKIGDQKPLGEPHLKYQSAPSGCNILAPIGNISKTTIFDYTVKPACQPPSPNFITRCSLAKNEVPIIPISALGSHLGEWTLKAIVTAKGGIQYHRLVEGDVKVKCVGCAVVNHFYPYVEVGKVYMVSKGSLKHYNHLKNEWLIILKATSMLEKCEEDCSIPHQQFLFTPISEIKNVETILYWMSLNGTENVKRKLVLNDVTNETVEISLWGKFCDNEGQVLQEMFTLELFPILAVKAVRLNDVNGKSVDTISSSQLFYNPDMPEARALRSWFDTGAKDIAAFSFSREPSQLFITPYIRAFMEKYV
ncbi:hypothetical protein MKW92_043380 [Papaver armeniacum]|nr:hypothetical protein MKW92_043380 [Papaver armeniacum]